MEADESRRKRWPTGAGRDDGAALTAGCPEQFPLPEALSLIYTRMWVGSTKSPPPTVGAQTLTFGWAPALGRAQAAAPLRSIWGLAASFRLPQPTCRCMSAVAARSKQFAQDKASPCSPPSRRWVCSGGERGCALGSELTKANVVFPMLCINSADVTGPAEATSSLGC